MQEQKGETWLDDTSGALFGLCSHGCYWIWDTETLFGATCHQHFGNHDACVSTEADFLLLLKSKTLYPRAQRLN